MDSNPKPTLCWDCENSVLRGCSWFECFKPVEGWNADKQLVDGQVSYLVKECPLFVRDAYKNGRYNTTQYIEHLEGYVARLNQKNHKLNEKIRELEKEIADMNSTKPKKAHKHFGESTEPIDLRA